jgi:hypothetical protein
MKEDVKFLDANCCRINTILKMLATNYYVINISVTNAGSSYIFGIVQRTLKRHERHGCIGRQWTMVLWMSPIGCKSLRVFMHQLLLLSHHSIDSKGAYVV